MIVDPPFDELLPQVVNRKMDDSQKERSTKKIIQKNKENIE
jgi:hypothetical protein